MKLEIFPKTFSFYKTHHDPISTFPSSKGNGMIQLPLPLMPPLGTWFDSCYLPSSVCKNMVKLLLPPMLASFTFGMVQLLLPPMLTRLSLAWFNSCYLPCLIHNQHLTIFPLLNHTTVCTYSLFMFQPHGCITPVHFYYMTIKMLHIHTNAQQGPACISQHQICTSNIGQDTQCQFSFHHPSSLANHL